MDVVTLGAALNGSKKYTDQVTQSLMGGVHYRGSVSYYDDLPNDASEGDSYTVKYAGTSGSVADGTEYTWGYDTDSQTYAWISFSKDAYSKAETDDTFVKKVDEYNAGKTVPSGTSVTIDETTYTVGSGAEIFNAYSDNKAIGAYAHAEGYQTVAIGMFSHAEGGTTIAKELGSHAEGAGSKANAMYSHAEGNATVTNAMFTHAEGYKTIASSENQHVEGKYNVEDSQGKFAHIIGNGTGNNARSNAFAVDWNGKIYTHNSNTGFDIQSNYIEFPNGQRLYNSSTAPTGDIPDGSIGIGW